MTLKITDHNTKSSSESSYEDWKQAKRRAASGKAAIDDVGDEIRGRINDLRQRAQAVDQDEELLLHVAAGVDPLTAFVACAEDEPVADYEDWKPYALVCFWILAGMALKFLILGV